MTSSEHSMKSMNCTFTESPTILSQPSRLSALRGNPSMRNRLTLCLSFSMASFNRRAVTSTGMILPSAMYRSIISPCSLPELRSSRSKSPAERCFTLRKSDTTFPHCVPFPAPGPPRMNTTLGLSAFPALLPTEPLRVFVSLEPGCVATARSWGIQPQRNHFIEPPRKRSGAKSPSRPPSIATRLKSGCWMLFAVATAGRVDARICTEATLALVRPIMGGARYAMLRATLLAAPAPGMTRLVVIARTIKLS
mmetsp:Transcript_3038/g.7211  ORF Transcript_3038/g.7211 Transcript_3038/m.7211 type:complete len:251 (+) Transcript_3038:386-1138(+)